MSRSVLEQPWIRPATRSDAAAIAHVHVESWNATYGSLLPECVLRRRGFARRMLSWLEVTGCGPSDNILVAETGDGMAGFASIGANRAEHPGYQGEIYTLYLLPEALGQGIGRSLFQACRERLHDQGYRGLIVWMLQGNAAAGFYTRMGGRVIDRRLSRLDEARVREIAYGWPD